ncbi:MAG: hypothetical protein ACI4PF_00695 [Christensenellales bacterium]
MKNNEQVESLNYKLWQRFNENSDIIKFLRDVNISEKFFNGEQYATNNVKNDPRVVMNICSFSATIKSAKICGTPFYVKFTSDNDEVSCLKLERFDQYNLSKLRLADENHQSALNGFNNGIDISMYRWDKNDTSYKGIYKGGLVLEHIRPKDFAVSNISLKDVQNQKWIMYRSVEEIANIKKLCENKERAKKIIPDDFRDGETSSEDTINFRTCELFTRFFRVDGEVFFMCSTRTVDLFDYPKAMNPRLNKIIAKRIKIKPFTESTQENSEYPDYDIDYEDAMIPYLKDDEWNDKEYSKEKEKFSLYPVAFFVPFVINGKFYGRIDTRQLVPTQQGINFGYNMMLKCAQNTAYQKIFAKEGALQGQQISNDPGELIIDHTKMTNGWGIKMAESQPMPNGLIEFTEKLIGMTRIINGFNNVMDGSISNTDISGYAFQQMVKQSNTSLEQQQQIFWQFQNDLAAIRLQFYKFYVDKAKYTYGIGEAEVSKQQDALDELNKMKETKQLEIGNVSLPENVKDRVVEEFSGSQIYGSNFDINIEVVQGLVDSELAESQIWDTLIMNGGIKNLTPEMLEMYLEANPVISTRTKQALKTIVEKQKREENSQLKTENEELSSKLRQALGLIQQLTAQNKGLGNYNQNLQKEFKGKIDVANKTILAQNDEISKLRGTQGEIKSLNSRGVEGGEIYNY